MERWKIEYNIRCYEIATLMMKYEFDINRVDRILSKVYKESVENSVNSGIIEERGWITKNGRRIYIGEDGGGSGKSKIEAVLIQKHFHKKQLKTAAKVV